MKKFAKIIYVSLFSFLISGCYTDIALDEEVIDIPGDHHNIVGTWRLISYCNWAWGNGCVDVPETDPKSIIIFDENGTYTAYRDDNLISEGKYKIVFKENMLVKRVEEIIEMDNRGDYSFTLTADNELWLSLIAFDAPGSGYTRVSYETDN